MTLLKIYQIYEHKCPWSYIVDYLKERELVGPDLGPCRLINIGFTLTKGEKCRLEIHEQFA